MATPVSYNFFDGYNPASTSFVYGVYGPWLPLPKFVKTSGSSTTVVEVNSGDGPFEGLAINDQLLMKANGQTKDDRTLTGVASNASATVNSAVNWENSGAGRPCKFRKHLSGTAATAGWVSTADLTNVTVSLVVTTLASTSVTFTIEWSASADEVPSTLYSETFTAVTVAGGLNAQEPIQIPESASRVRVGVKYNSSDGTDAVSASLHGTRA
jgi:hypothetical protein